MATAFELGKQLYGGLVFGLVFHSYTLHLLQVLAKVLSFDLVRMCFSLEIRFFSCEESLNLESLLVLSV